MAEPPLRLDGFVEALGKVPWAFVMAFVSLLLIYLLFRRRSDLFHRLAFAEREVAVLCLGSIAGWAINVPIVPMGSSFLAVNVGGAIVPGILVGLWYREGKLHVKRSLAGIALVTVVAYLVTAFDPATGVIARFPWFFLPSLAALGFALVVGFRNPVGSIPVAYAAGSLGALVGADVLRLRQIVTHFSAPSTEVTLVSIGGAGVFDMVFLAGALAMAGDLLVVTVATRRDGTPEPYPGPPLDPGDDDRAWRLYGDLPDPNPRERATAALALSNLALRDGDHGRSVRMSFLAVDALLKAGDPPLVTTLFRGGKVAAGELDRGTVGSEQFLVTTPVLVGDLKALARAYREAKGGTPSRTEAGRANQAAKLLAGSLVPLTGLPSRLGEGAP